MSTEEEKQLLSPEEIATLLLRNKKVQRETDRQTIVGLSIALGEDLSNTILRECQAEIEERSAHDK